MTRRITISKTEAREAHAKYMDFVPIAQLEEEHNIDFTQLRKYWSSMKLPVKRSHQRRRASDIGSGRPA